MTELYIDKSKESTLLSGTDEDEFSLSCVAELIILKFDYLTTGLGETLFSIGYAVFIAILVFSNCQL